MLIRNFAYMGSNCYYYMYVLRVEAFSRIYNKILRDHGWFSTPIFVKESVRDHVVIFTIVIKIVIVIINSRRREFRQLFRVLPIFHECFCNPIETRRTCFLFLLQNNGTKKEKTTSYFGHQNVNSLCSRHHYVNRSC